MKKFSYLTACILLGFASSANAESETRDRTHSVNKAIQTVAQTQEKSIEIVDQKKNLINEGKLTGQFRSLYSTYNNKNMQDTYATAIGGMLKYETAEYHGWNFAAAMVTTNDVRALSGDGVKHNSELSGDKRSYTELSEVYVNYNYEDFQFRVGRQVIDTPLADSDDSLMIANTFEAYTASYSSESWSFSLGHFDRWQGADADLNEGWVKTGKNGVNYLGALFTNKLLDISVWYYDFSNPSDSEILQGATAIANQTFYTDISAHIYFNRATFLHLNAQYLLQNSYDNSIVESNIYGLMGEIVYEGLGIRLAYNNSQREVNKESFVGYGGGPLYTSMDSATLDAINSDRSAYATVGILSYSFADFKLLYAYGLFKGDSDSQGVKAKVVEQNFGIEYSYNDALTFGAIYVIDRNKEDSSSTEFNDDNFRLLFAYNF